MFDVTTPGAQNAIDAMSDVLSGSPESQDLPMPSPNDARAKNTPDKKVVDLGQKLAKKRSQDFASKIQGWNQAGGGIVQEQDQVVVIEERAPEPKKVGKKASKSNGVAQVVVETEAKEVEVVEEEARPSRPTTPKTPGTPAVVTPKTSGAKKTGRDLDLERGAWVRRKSKPSNEPTPEVKGVGTPKKRVISDGHWRRDRTKEEPKPTPEKERDTTPKPVTIKRSVVNVGMKIPPSHQDFAESEPEPEPLRIRPLRQSRSRSRSPSADGRRGTPDYETSGTKVYIKRRRRSRTVEEDAKYKDPRKSESSFTAPSSIDKPSSATDITTPSTTPPKDIKRPVSEPRERLRKSASREDGRVRSATQALETEDAQRVASGGRRRAKTPVSDEDRLRPSTSAQAYAKKITEPLKKASTPPPPAPAPAAPAPPKVYGNRIEGWLANMPDPFTDARSLTPEPLDIPKKKSRKRLDAEVDNTPPDENRKSSGQRRTSRKELVRDIEDRHEAEDSGDWSPSGPASLKRRGARKKSTSPVKGRDSRDSTPTNDAMMSGALPNSSLQSSRTSSANTQSDRFRIPSGGRPLSTILSVDTQPPPRAPPHKRQYPTIPEDASIADGSVLSRASDGDSPRRNGTGLKRRATKHEDLMSVLSMSRDDSHPITSRRSIRASRRQARPEPATVGDVMNELSTDELRYQRELRTLVDGVIPVLLQHALSDNGSAPAKRVFSHPTSDTRPIVDMGVALEKLKTMHKRIPMHEPGELLIWADGAARLYSEYLRAWRLGFKDIVVNLAPAEQTSKKHGSAAWDDGLPRNKDGDLVDGKGERVDVAYLLKRPLVRVKHLAKVFKIINQLQPSANAEDMTARYNDLVADAKRRVNDEQARLEDEAASAIDATRARDPRSLAPITGVSIDPTRSVRARDYFDMDMNHSSGQQLGCKIEIIYRDDAPDRGKAGDLLFCEVSTVGRWLLFPPLPLSLVSARKGERPGEMVVMIRGFLSNARQWREVMSLQADDEQTAIDWLPMLGSSPMPPRLSRKSSFNMLKAAPVPASGSAEPFGQSGDSPDKSRDPSPREIEVPIGERAKSSSRIWDGSEVNSVYTEDEPTTLRTTKAKRYYTTISPAAPDDIHQNDRDNATQPAYFYDQPRHDMHSGHAARRPVTSHARSKSEWTGSSITASSQNYSVWMPSEDRDQYSDGSVSDEDRPGRRKSKRPGMHRRTSSVPSMDMPTIPKLRQPSTPKRPESPSSDRDMLPSQKRAAAEREADPASAPAKLQKRRLSMSKAEPEKDKAPPASKQSRPMSLGLKSNIIPSFTPAWMKKDRRPSSPLKHEYEPSSASDSLSDSYFSDLDDIESLTSESNVDDEDEDFSKREDVSTVGDLNAFQQYTMRGARHSPPPASLPVLPENSLDPSESASQAPYRSVPPTRMEPAKTVACIFSWSEKGTWDSLHPEECQIYVTPGLIEAFDIAQANSVPLSGDGEELTPSAKGIRPLIALELTPLVPLRRGTAVDISIRSPPTANSVIRMGNNVMFRSRSPEECEKLYNLINRARIDNPTYIALQNARGPPQQSNWGEVMDRRNNLRSTGKSWWNLGSKMGSSYRSKGSRTASIAATESSVGTVGSAFSALRRFSAGSRIFDLAKSTIQSKTGTRSTQSESLSSGAATPIPFDTSMGTPVGITNAKVRLYVRESAAKWRDMGSARLNVMLPPRPDPSIPANPKTTGAEKRILLYGKSKGELILDVTLGESAFERVARTGIAVSVYQEKEHIGAVGGVMSAKTTVFMIQMKSERDAAYTFGLVGKLRY
ncbi:hypothetical protein M409DRAFT_70043 [Zasmidium cellare ATCC 36951]|uniref:Uncharacterized protein n=1 Tax=Zasmidium cellare ATCC 36951 TaxID=1080233 RepID=A0A6A6C5E1_ZASCE|nr:uncharacterized protein M409DRAFT_70043 [Zasmidium cellare ATCC 36951]KAF2160959.1 hypothetical protein M409DRAFT_70043 [Zasmidium cellare ATCC 36951]